MKFEKFLILAIVLLAIFYSTTTLDFTNCGSYYIDNVTIDGCSDDATCELIIGTDTNFSFDLRSAHVSNSFNSEVFLMLRGQKFPISATPSDPCSVFPCPIEENYQNHYEATLHINDTFYPFQAEFYWINNDDWSEKAICIEVDLILNYGPESDEDYF